MATAWVRVDDFEALPGVCAKTGEPTEVRLSLPAEYVPVWFRWLMLFSVWSFLFAKAADARRRHVRVPVSPKAFRKFRRCQLAAVTVFLPGLAVGLTASITTHPAVEAIAYGLAFSAFVLGSIAQQRYWITLYVDRRGREVTVQRCHPAFARAAGAIAARPGILRPAVIGERLARRPARGSRGSR